MSELWLINPVKSGSRSAKALKKRKHMAKSKSLKGRARDSKGRLLPKSHRKTSRKYHKKHRKVGTRVTIKGGKKRRVHMVRRHISNPFGFPTMGGVTNDLKDALIGLAAFAGAVWASNQVSAVGGRFIPGTQGRMGNLALKLGAGVVALMLGRKFINDPKLRHAIVLGAMAPVLMDTLNQFAPGVVAMASVPMLPMAQAPAQVGYDSMDAQLEAQLEAGLY